MFVDEDTCPFLLVRGPIVDIQGRDRAESQSATLEDSFSELWKSDALAGVGFEDSTKNSIKFVGDRKDGFEKVRIANVSRIRLVAWLSSLPRVASTCEADKNDAQGPNIVRGGLVAR